MSPNRFSHRAFAVFALLTALVVVPFPVQAQEARRPVQRFQAVTFLGDGSLEGIWRFVLSLLPQGRSNEGMTIDPNGGHQGTATTSSAFNNEGVLIDPNGRH